MRVVEESLGLRPSKGYILCQQVKHKLFSVGICSPRIHQDLSICFDLPFIYFHYVARRPHLFWTENYRMSSFLLSQSSEHKQDTLLVMSMLPLHVFSFFIPNVLFRSKRSFKVDCLRFQLFFKMFLKLIGDNYFSKVLANEVSLYVIT